MTRLARRTDQEWPIACRPAPSGSAARAGKTSAFWWGDEPTHPAGANFLGPEPSLPTDTTAPSLTPEGKPGFQPNPWGLYHTFGNIAEWATLPGGGFVRMGGHFRTEPKSPPPEDEVAQDDTTGPDPYVGVRPVLDLDAEKGAEVVRRALHGNKALEAVEVSFDPDRATATLTGTLPEPFLRRSADQRLQGLWFLAAVENQIKTPTAAPWQLAPGRGGRTVAPDHPAGPLALRGPGRGSMGRPLAGSRVDLVRQRLPPRRRALRAPAHPGRTGPLGSDDSPDRPRQDAGGGPGGRCARDRRPQPGRRGPDSRRSPSREQHRPAALETALRFEVARNGERAPTVCEIGPNSRKWTGAPDPLPMSWGGGA